MQGILWSKALLAFGILRAQTMTCGYGKMESQDQISRLPGNFVYSKDLGHRLTVASTQVKV